MWRITVAVDRRRVLLIVTDFSPTLFAPVLGTLGDRFDGAA